MSDELRRVFCCPSCRGDLAWAEDVTTCLSCRVDYLVSDGIADFRLSVSNREKAIEWDKARAQFRNAASSTFLDLLRDAVLSEASSPEILLVELEYELEWEKRGRKALDRLRKLLVKAGAPPPEELLAKGVSLDIGCGKGVLLGTYAPMTKYVIGIDSSVEYLCFSRALMRERGYVGWALAVAEAESLPFRESALQFVSVLDVIEHLCDQRAGIGEAFRVLVGDGYLFLNSPNRYSLMAPEDHCRLWFVGFLPYRWQAMYVRWKANRSYKGVRLLSYPRTKRMLSERARILAEEAVMAPGVPDQASSFAERMLSKHSFLRWILNSPPLKYFTPSHHFLARK